MKTKASAPCWCTQGKEKKISCQRFIGMACLMIGLSDSMRTEDSEEFEHPNLENLVDLKIAFRKVKPKVTFSQAMCKLRNQIECNKADVQAPRDLSENATGNAAATFYPLTEKAASKLSLTNMHFHLGAEHKVRGQYDDDEDLAIWNADKRRDLHHRPGFMCTPFKALSPSLLQSYAWKHCENMQIGKTYEVHYVWSSAGRGDETFADGLGNAAGNLNGYWQKEENPFIRVQAQVFHVVNDGNTTNSPHYISGEAFLNGWQQKLAADRVRYAGSTTGTTFNNVCCSPYDISWHVDRQCHLVSAQSFDEACGIMKTKHKMKKDIKPHGSRMLVHEDFVVPWAEVFKMNDGEAC